MTTDIGSLLERASAAPFGPLSLTCRVAGTGWSFTVQLQPREPVIVEALRDAASGGLCLERRFAAGAESDLRDLIDSAPWVMDLDTAGIGVALRIWLHGDGLQMNTLLSALAYFARLEAGELGGEVGKVAAEPAAAVQPDSQPVVPVRPLAWQSFATASLESAPSVTPAPTASTEPPVPDSIPEPEPPTASTTIDEPAPESSDEASKAVDASVVQPPTPPPESGAAATALSDPVGVGGNCRECGSPFPPDHTFCTTCGARLT